MKTKRTLITVLIAALLVSVALIVGCSSPGDGMFSEKESAKSNNYILPAGKGAIRISIPDSNARTILPDSASFPLTDMYFKVELESATGGTDTIFPASGTSIYADIVGTPIVAAADDYDITITAYADSLGTQPIAGWSPTAPGYGGSGTSGSYEITAGGTTTVSANLIAFQNAVDGFFAYNITIPNGTYDLKELKITGYSNPSFLAITRTLNEEGPGPTPIVNTNVNGGAPNGESIPSGYYTVTITLEKDHHQTIQYLEALHIYPAMTSKYDKVITASTDPLIQNEFPVTFNLGSTAISNSSAFTPNPKYVGYAKLLNTIATPSPVASSIAFGGWYSDASLAPAYFLDPDTVRILAARSIYAEYVPSGFSNGITITFTFNTPTSITADNSSTISRDDFTGGHTVKLSLDSSAIGGGTWSNITWHIAGIPDGIVDSHKEQSAPGVYTGALVINNSEDFFSLLAPPEPPATTKSFMVTVTADLTGSTTGNGYYSGSTYISVID
ncbi:MAG: hypothetical protein LBC76_00440 [Treponema sp.]|jgi:hypothetical protein|nr:hypothetical protein [Treponema sp.]